ncbi:MAG: bifunctional folylpolyglutamate synthase/dihydrofolate synthase [Treponema sp.]|jgi:dihydrofolate synthase/folylpolyglutamate synthase|nr:bifunctional folylpolyglutamate synthase/dihydrofolate synthase [Treponema sp.]
MDKNKTNFTGSADVFAWLSRFINLGRGQSFKSFRLDRMEVLNALAGNPEKCAPAIHVAGSKGKGSVTGMISAILEAEGLKTARYTSPHVSEYRERIMLGNTFFSESVYIEAGNELREITAALGDGSKNRTSLFDPRQTYGEEPTFFELLTLYFFLCARKARCQAMVLETGMGGRLDATNIVDPLVSVITLIELEHTEYLGHTIAAIAGEKAGIIKAGRPLILAEQEKEALDVFKTQTGLKGSSLIYFPDVAELKKMHLSREGTAFTLDFKKPGFFSSPLELFLPIPGKIQGKNAGLAILAAKTAFPALGETAIREGLRDFRLPARFEEIKKTPPVIIDGAHTRHSTEECLDTFTRLYGEGGILIFGCAAGKDVESMAKILLPHFSAIIITTPGTYKKSYPQEIYEIFQDQLSKTPRQGLPSGTPARVRPGAPAGLTPASPGGPPERGDLLFIPETGEAIRTAVKLGKERGLPVLGTGSFYLAAEIRQLLIGA